MSNRSQVISLFDDHKPVRRGASSVFLSGIFHGLGAALLWFGLLHAPRIREPLLTERYSVRHLDLHSSELGSGSNPNDHYYPHVELRKKTSKDHDQDEPVLPDLPDAIEAKQTLVQPDFHTLVTLTQQVPIPTVVVWTPELASTNHIVAPLPDKPNSIDAKPSLDTPNRELNPAEHAVATPTVLTNGPVLPTGTTTPLAMRTDSLLRLAPATTSESPDQPTPTALLSVSDLRMTDGIIIVPPVSQTHTLSGEDIPLTPAGSSPAGTDAPGSNDGFSMAARAQTMQHIELPKDGRFGVIVVGTSLSDVYPQTMQIWSDRVAYTAYLHVGLAKNWILQYAQLRSTEAADNGNVARLEAPWPYDILRPNLVSSDLNADALMIHGILNEAGQLESLAVAFPQQFAQAEFVLQALEKWQFRPARQQGKPTAVEVLLIIPDELN